MGFTAELLEQHAPEWRAAVEHEFIQRVGDGSIEASQFETWLVQDYLYVQALVNYLGLLIAQSPPELTRPLGGAVVTLNDELDLFRSQAAQLGVVLEGASPLPANRDYIHFMQAVGHTGSFLCGLAVLWGLEKVYLDAWRHARGMLGPGLGNSRWRGFIEQWTTPGFTEWVSFLSFEVDRLAKGAPATDLSESHESFAQMLRLEQRFWQLAFDKGLAPAELQD